MLRGCVANVFVDALVGMFSERFLARWPFLGWLMVGSAQRCNIVMFGAIGEKVSRRVATQVVAFGGVGSRVASEVGLATQGATQGASQGRVQGSRQVAEGSREGCSMGAGSAEGRRGRSNGVKQLIPRGLS